MSSPQDNFLSRIQHWTRIADQEKFRIPYVETSEAWKAKSSLDEDTRCPVCLCDMFGSDFPDKIKTPDFTLDAIAELRDELCEGTGTEMVVPARVKCGHVYGRSCLHRYVTELKQYECLICRLDMRTSEAKTEQEREEVVRRENRAEWLGGLRWRQRWEEGPLFQPPHDPLEEERGEVARRETRAERLERLQGMERRWDRIVQNEMQQNQLQQDIEDVMWERQLIIPEALLPFVWERRRASGIEIVEGIAVLEGLIDGIERRQTARLAVLPVHQEQEQPEEEDIRNPREWNNRIRLVIQHMGEEPEQAQDQAEQNIHNAGDPFHWQVRRHRPLLQDVGVVAPQAQVQVLPEEVFQHLVRRLRAEEGIEEQEPNLADVVAQQAPEQDLDGWDQIMEHLPPRPNNWRHNFWNHLPSIAALLEWVTWIGSVSFWLFIIAAWARGIPATNLALLSIHVIVIGFVGWVLIRGYVEMEQLEEELQGFGVMFGWR